MSRLENRVEKLEAGRETSGGIFVFVDHGDDDLEMRRREFIEEHGHEPDVSIEVRFE